MLDGSEVFVVLKLVTGEQVMAVLRQEDEERVLLESPLHIRMIPMVALGKESIAAAPLCHFTDDTIYLLNKKDIMFCKKLHQMFIPHYLKIVKDIENTAHFSPPDILEETTEENNDTGLDSINFVEGNDVLH